MIRSQGRYFTQEQLDRIVILLRDTEMSLPEIACRMRCSRSAIAAINQRYRVRQYGGRRSQWTLHCAAATSTEDRDPRVA